jgi:hypothetical protein
MSTEDLTHTPPAPPLTIPQQRLLLFCVTLGRGQAEFINKILTTFEETLVSFQDKALKLNVSKQVCTNIYFII